MMRLPCGYALERRKINTLNSNSIERLRAQIIEDIKNKIKVKCIPRVPSLCPVRLRCQNPLIILAFIPPVYK